MDVTFTEEQEALRAAVRDLLADHSDAAHVRAVFSGDAGTDLDLYRRLIALGVADLPGTVELGVVLEECGRVLAPAPLVPVLGLTAVALSVCAEGGSAEAEDLLAAVRRGDARVVPCLQLPVEGVLRNVIEPNAATHVLYVDRGRLRAMAVDDADIVMHPTMDQLRRLGDVRLADAAGVDVGPAGPALEAANRNGAVAVSHELVGVAQACLDMAVAHARQREQFGKPIGTYQAISHRCAEMFVALESARSHAYFAAWAVDAGDERAELAASQAKAAASEAAVACAQGCIQVHGGIGFTWEHDAHLYLKRARSGSVLLGTASDHRRRIADLICV